MHIIYSALLILGLCSRAADGGFKYRNRNIVCVYVTQATGKISKECVAWDLFHCHFLFLILTSPYFIQQDIVTSEILKFIFFHRSNFFEHLMPSGDYTGSIVSVSRITTLQNISPSHSLKTSFHYFLI